MGGFVGSSRFPAGNVEFFLTGAIATARVVGRRADSEVNALRAKALLPRLIRLNMERRRVRLEPAGEWYSWRVGVEWDGRSR